MASVHQNPLLASNHDGWIFFCILPSLSLLLSKCKSGPGYPSCLHHRYIGFSTNNSSFSLIYSFASLFIPAGQFAKTREKNKMWFTLSPVSGSFRMDAVSSPWILDYGEWWMAVALRCADNIMRGHCVLQRKIHPLTHRDIVGLTWQSTMEQQNHRPSWKFFFGFF